MTTKPDSTTAATRTTITKTPSRTAAAPAVPPPPTSPAAPLLEAIAGNAATALSAALGGGSLVSFQVGDLGNFPYYYNDPATGNFNILTYDWINQSLNNNTPPITQEEGIFANTYTEALANVTFALSAADLATLTTAQTNSSTQTNALITAWTQNIGTPAGTGTGPQINSIMATVISWAPPGTTLINVSTAKNLRQLLGNMPASGELVLTPLAKYLNAINSVVPLQSASTMNPGYLIDCLTNVQSASSGNGGLTCSDGNTYPAYTISPDLPDLQAQLGNTNSTVSATMTVSQSSDSDSCNVQVSEGESFGIGFSDFLTFTMSESTSENYFQTDIVSDSSNSVSVVVTYTGPTLVNFGPAEFDLDTENGWFWLDPITQALTNGQSGVTGFSFASPSDATAQPSYYATSGNFGYLTGVAIANYPSVAITITNSNTQTISTISDNITNSNTFTASILGFGLGSSTTDSTSSSCSASTKTNTSGTSVTITLTPPPAGPAGSTSLAWIIGVQTLYPAASS